MVDTESGLDVEDLHMVGAESAGGLYGCLLPVLGGWNPSWAILDG